LRHLASSSTRRRSAVLLGAVEEIFLELIEDDQRLRIDGRRGLFERRSQLVSRELDARACWEQRLHGGLDPRDQLFDRIVLPLAEHDRHVAS